MIQRQESDWIDDEHQPVEVGVQQPPEPIICWAESDDSGPRRRPRWEPMLFFGLTGVFLLVVVGVAVAHHDLSSTNRVDTVCSSRRAW